jgi:hypothetical protein
MVYQNDTLDVSFSENGVMRSPKVTRGQKRKQGYFLIPIFFTRNLVSQVISAIYKSESFFYQKSKINSFSVNSSVIIGRNDLIFKIFSRSSKKENKVK